jgi:hypothetical protein
VEVATLRAHDAHGHGVPQAEGVADGHDIVADAHFLARSEGGDGKILGSLELEDGDVEARVLALDLRVELALVGELDLDLVGAIDDVGVGHHVPLRVDDEATREPVAS